MQTRLLLIGLGCGLLLAACGPTPVDESAVVTQAAATIYAEQTAEAQAMAAAPTDTPSPPPAATATPTPLASTATATPTPVPPLAPYAIVHVPLVALRSNPSGSSPPVVNLPVGTVLRVLSGEGDWLQVQVEGGALDGKAGWVSLSEVELAQNRPEATATRPPTPTRGATRTPRPAATPRPTAAPAAQGEVVTLYPFCNCQEQIGAGQPVELTWAWLTVEPGQAADFARLTRLCLTVDGRSLNGLERYWSDVTEDPEGYKVRWTYPLGALAAGTHRVELAVSAETALTDGFDGNGDGQADVYGPGEIGFGWVEIAVSGAGIATCPNGSPANTWTLHVVNPSGQDQSFSVDGQTYTVPAGGTRDVYLSLNTAHPVTAGGSTINFSNDRPCGENTLTLGAQAQPPAPPPAPPAAPGIPAGKGALVMLNCRGDVVTVDVIPVGIFQELAPKTGPDCQPGAPIYLDPGEYILKASIAGVPSTGEATITIVAGGTLRFTWN